MPHKWQMRVQNYSHVTMHRRANAKAMRGTCVPISWCIPFAGLTWKIILIAPPTASNGHDQAPRKMEQKTHLAAFATQKPASNRWLGQRPVCTRAVAPTNSRTGVTRRTRAKKAPDHAGQLGWICPKTACPAAIIRPPARPIAQAHQKQTTDPHGICAKPLMVVTASSRFPRFGQEPPVSGCVCGP